MLEAAQGSPLEDVEVEAQTSAHPAPGPSSSGSGSVKEAEGMADTAAASGAGEEGMGGGGQTPTPLPPATASVSSASPEDAAALAAPAAAAAAVECEGDAWSQASFLGGEGGGGACSSAKPGDWALGEQLAPFAFKLNAGMGTASAPGIIPLPRHLWQGARRAAAAAAVGGGGGCTGSVFVSVEQAALEGYTGQDAPLPVFEEGEERGLFTYDAPLSCAPFLSGLAFWKALRGQKAPLAVAFVGIEGDKVAANSAGKKGRRG